MVLGTHHFSLHALCDSDVQNVDNAIDHCCYRDQRILFITDIHVNAVDEVQSCFEIAHPLASHQIMVEFVGGVISFNDKIVQELQFGVQVRHISFDERIHECGHEVVSPKFFHVYAAVLPIRNNSPRYIQNDVRFFYRISGKLNERI